MNNEDISIEELIEALNEPDNQKEIEGGRQLYKTKKIYEKLDDDLMVDLEKEDIRNFINSIPLKDVEGLVSMDDETFNQKVIEWVKNYNINKEKRKIIWDKVSENGYGI